MMKSITLIALGQMAPRASQPQIGVSHHPENSKNISRLQRR
jgi:hypothetical protein